MTDTKITLAGDLGKPADTLIKKISAATGAIFEPAQIIRIAKAEAKADVIRAEARVEVQKIEAQTAIEIHDVQQRAAMRWIGEETRKQQNIEAITGKAIARLDKDAQTEELEEDWVAHFFDKSRLVSDEDMQELWAKLLAGEANKPGSYSNHFSIPNRTKRQLVTRSKSDVDPIPQKRQRLSTGRWRAPTSAAGPFTKHHLVTVAAVCRASQCWNRLILQGPFPESPQDAAGPAYAPDRALILRTPGTRRAKMHLIRPSPRLSEAPI